MLANSKDVCQKEDEIISVYTWKQMKYLYVRELSYVALKI